MSHPDDLIAAAYDAESPYAAHPGALVKSQVNVKASVRHSKSGAVVQVKAHTMTVDKHALVALLASHMGGHENVPDHAGLHEAIDRALDQHHEAQRIKHIRHENGAWRTSNTKPQAAPGAPQLHVGGGKVKATVGGELKGHVAITHDASPAPDLAPPPVEPAPAPESAGKVTPLAIDAQNFSARARAYVRLTTADAQRAYDQGLPLISRFDRNKYETDKVAVTLRDAHGAGYELTDNRTYLLVIKHGQQLPDWIDGQLPPVQIEKLVAEALYGNKPPSDVTVVGKSTPAMDEVVAIAKPSEQAQAPAWNPTPPDGGWSPFPETRDSFGSQGLMPVAQMVGRWQRNDRGEGWPDPDVDGAWMQATMRWAVAHNLDPNHPRIVKDLGGKYPGGKYPREPEAGHLRAQAYQEAQQWWRDEEAKRIAKFGPHADHLAAAIAAIPADDKGKATELPQGAGVRFGRALDTLHSELFEAQRAIRGQRNKGEVDDATFAAMLEGNQRARAALEIISRAAKGTHMPHAPNLVRIARGTLTQGERQALVKAVADLGHRFDDDLKAHLEEHGDMAICVATGMEYREPGTRTVERLLKRHKAEVEHYKRVLDEEDAAGEHSNAKAAAAREVDKELQDAIASGKSPIRLAEIRGRAQRARGAWNVAFEEFSKIQSIRRAVKGKYAHLFREAAGGFGQAQLTTEIDKEHDFTRPHSVETGIELFSLMAGNRHDTLSRPVVFEVKDANSRADFVSRSSHHDKDLIRISDTAPIDTTIHELGHYFEMNSPFVQKAALGFLFDRVKDDPIVPLKTHGEHYGDDEHCCPDNFMSPYIGKIYTHSLGPPADKFSAHTTEIVSMGIEQMYRDPVLFMIKDPGHAAFIIDMLRSGTVR